jgi:hypothetical protein
MKRLNSQGQHWIPILDAGVAVSNGYSAYKEGNKDSIWIKDYTGEETFVGQVRRGKGHLTHHCCVHSALV